MPTPTVGNYIGKIDVDGIIHPLGSTLYGTCNTAASTSAKSVVCPGFVEYDDDADIIMEGVTIHVKFSQTNTAASATLNVSGTGSKPILGTSGTISGTPKWSAGAVVSFTYDGSYWCMNDVYFVDTDTKNTAGSTNSTSKLFLVGATGQSANPQTYSNTDVYATNGALHASTFNGYTLGAACAKAIGSVASGNTGLVTGGDVYTAIQSAAAGSLQYQGTATSNSDIGTSYHAGWYWVVGSAGGTIAGQTVEAGDMILAHADYSGTLADDLDIVQSNVDRITNSDIDTIVAA